MAKNVKGGLHMPFLFLSPSTQDFNPYVTTGNEQYWMNQLADRMEPYLFASGVNVTRNDGTNKNVFIIYSLGNFLTSHDLEYTDAGIILDFTVQEQPNGTFEVVDIGYVPTYCWTHDGGVEVVPAKVYLENRPSNMSDASYQRMKSTYEGNVQLLGSDFKVLDK